MLASTGGAVVLCSYTTTVGYGSLLLSQNLGIRSFGIAAMLGEITCLVMALYLAPSLLWPVRRERAGERARRDAFEPREQRGVAREHSDGDGGEARHERRRGDPHRLAGERGAERARGHAAERAEIRAERHARRGSASASSAANAIG